MSTQNYAKVREDLRIRVSVDGINNAGLILLEPKRIRLDDPRHQRLRNIVSRAFGPRVVARTEASVRDRARRLAASMITASLTAEASWFPSLQGHCRCR